jgi:hypothetical protein
MDIEFTNAVDASIMSTVDMMQSCILRDSGDDALKSEQVQDVDMDVDMPTNETVQANAMNIGSPQHEHIKYKVCPSTPNPHPNTLKAPPCHHNRSTQNHRSQAQSRPHFRRCSQAAAQAPQAPRGRRRQIQSPSCDLAEQGHDVFCTARQHAPSSETSAHAGEEEPACSCVCGDGHGHPSFYKSFVSGGNRSSKPVGRLLCFFVMSIVIVHSW